MAGSTVTLRPRFSQAAYQLFLKVILFAFIKVVGPKINVKRPSCDDMKGNNQNRTCYGNAGPFLASSSGETSKLG